VIVTRDGWLKRIRATNDPEAARIREGDSVFFSQQASTKDTLLLFTNVGNVFGTAIYDVLATTGFGEPVQKMFRFQDGELITGALVLPKGGKRRRLRTPNPPLFEQGERFPA